MNLVSRALSGDLGALLLTALCLGAGAGASLLLVSLGAVRRHLAQHYVSQEEYLTGELKRRQDVADSISKPLTGVQTTLAELFALHRGTDEKLSRMNRELGEVSAGLKAIQKP